MPVRWCFHKEKNLTILTVLCNLLPLIPKILSSTFYTSTLLQIFITQNVESIILHYGGLDPTVGSGW